MGCQTSKPIAPIHKKPRTTSTSTQTGYKDIAVQTDRDPYQDTSHNLLEVAKQLQSYQLQLQEATQIIYAQKNRNNMNSLNSINNMSRGSSRKDRDRQSISRLSPEMKQTARRKMNNNSPRIEMKRISRKEFKQASRIDALKKEESGNFSKAYKNSQTLKPRATINSLQVDTNSIREKYSARSSNSKKSQISKSSRRSSSRLENSPLLTDGKRNIGERSIPLGYFKTAHKTSLTTSKNGGVQKAKQDVNYKKQFLQRNTLKNQSEFPKIVQNIVPQNLPTGPVQHRKSVASPRIRNLNCSSREISGSRGSSTDKKDVAILVPQKSAGGIARNLRGTSFFQDLKELQVENNLKGNNEINSKPKKDSSSELSSEDESSSSSFEEHKLRSQPHPMSGTGGQKLTKHVT